MPRQTNGKSPGRPLWDRQHNCGVEWEEWGYPHNILPRARPYSIDQPGVYTSNSTLYFIRNCPKWRQIQVHLPVGHVPLDSPNRESIINPS